MRILVAGGSGLLGNGIKSIAHEYESHEEGIPETVKWFIPAQI
jgi:hypothetical protein